MLSLIRLALSESALMNTSPSPFSPPVSDRILGHDNSGMLIEAEGGIVSMSGDCHVDTALPGGSMSVKDYLGGM